MKKFKTRKRKKFLKLLVVIIVIYIISRLTFNYLLNIKIDNKNLISWSLSNSSYSMSNNGFIDDVVDFFKSINPVDMLSFTMKNDYYSSSEGDINDLTNYIDDPNYKDIDNPKIYIYNTHQLEGYVENNEYDITPNVQMASYLLKDKLNNYNIPTIVEMSSVGDLLNSNGWDYSYSYKASRYFLIEALKKYNDLDLIIDLHRDSIPHDVSTIEYNGKKYAKILFVVGEDYDTYKSNLSLANTLNNMLKNHIENISRGVITKGGKGVNGIYNQDLNNKIILIECGGMENTLDEVINTVNLLADVIKEYIGD